MESVTALVIGDPHFKANNLKEGKIYLEKCLIKAKSKQPDFIVCLGDILDTHEIGRSQPYNLALEFIEKLSNVAPFYLIIGNHDLINNQQFLTDAHFFNALKGKENITIVDRPIERECRGNTFVFVPYVPKGRFVEALNHLLKDGESWELADCIFAHQEFKGCKMGAIESSDGDEWDENYPPVVSGHIHDSQIISPNIYYPGSSIQHAYGESPDKRIWYLTFNEEFDDYFKIEKIDLEMKGKKMVYMDLGDVEDFPFSECDKYNIKLSLKGKSEDFKIFRKSSTFQKLKKYGVKISYSPILDSREDLQKRTREEVSYRGMLKTLVLKEDSHVLQAYEEVLGEKLRESVEENYSSDEENCMTELVFEE